MPIANNRQNRRERKKNLKTYKATARKARKDWGEWEEKPIYLLPRQSQIQAKNSRLLKDLKAFWVNDFLSVQLSEIETEIGTVKRLGIRRNDEGKNISWAEKQRVKNELCGENAIAVEVFPSEDELIDQVNMFWLWVLPEGYKLPFSLKK